MQYIKDILHAEGSIFEKILDRRERDARISEVVCAKIPPHLATYVTVLGFENKNLFLLATNASIASSLRFSLPSLIKALKSEPLLEGITSIVLRVAVG